MSSRGTDDLSPWPPIRDTPGGYPKSPNEPETEAPIESTPQSLAQAVKARKSEYVRKKTVKVKIGSWNVASINGTEKDLGGWFVEGKGIHGLSEDGTHRISEDAAGSIESVSSQEAHFKKKKPTLPQGDVPSGPAGDEVGIYVLGLQEVVDVSSASEALRPYSDPSTSRRWKKAMEDALPFGYQKIAEEQLLGLLILIYASSEIAPTISSVSTTSVGTGLLGYMGNKGAVSARLVLGETTRLVFVDCHLAAGSDKAALDRRNWDAAQVVARTRFDPITDINGVSEDFGDGIGDEDFAFWFGDLNFRLDDIPGDDVRRLLLLHTKNEYDVNNKSKRKIDSELGYIAARPSEDHSEHTPDKAEEESDVLDPQSDPASLHTTIQSLLPHDQLRKQQKARKAFHDGWREGEIDFLPTYKYDVGSVGMFDSGEKKRGPSWCDRILFRTRGDRLRAAEREKQEQEAKKRDEEMKARGIDEASSENDVLFDYDPDNDALAYGDDNEDYQENADAPDVFTTRDGFEETVTLDHYTSHQRVLSSDHKPLDAVFTLEYEAVVPELRAKVHQEVAKQLDKAENEGRPAITIVIDRAHREGFSADEVTEDDSTDTHSIEFGQVRYRSHKSRSMTLANTGSVTATVSFIDRPVAEGEKGGIAPRWLSVQVEKPSNNANLNPSALHEYSLQPGETANVELTVDIDTLKVVQRLNTGIIKMDDVLVLRVNNGRDHFIPVRGRWIPSCLCRRIEELILVPETGIRRQNSLLSSGAYDQRTESGSAENGKSFNPESSDRVSAPRELFALTEGIQEYLSRSIAEWDMTHSPSEPRPWQFSDAAFNGWPFSESTRTLTASPHRSSLICGVFTALDSGEPLKDHFPEDAPSLLRLEALSEALLIFLSSLPDGVVTSDLWHEIDCKLRDIEKTKSQVLQEDMQTMVLEVISSQPAHNISFTFLQFMLVRTMHEVAPPSKKSDEQQKVAQGPQSHAPLEESAGNVTSPTSPSGKAASVFSSLSLRGRRTRTSTSSSTASTGVAGAADVASTMTAQGLSTVDSDRRAAMVKAYSLIFADMIFHSGNPPSSHKERKASVERKRKILEVFLQ